MALIGYLVIIKSACLHFFAEDEASSDEEVSQHDEHCAICHKDDNEDMLLCDGCPKAFHLACLGLQAVPDGDWYCAVCCDEPVNDQ